MKHSIFILSLLSCLVATAMQEKEFCAACAKEEKEEEKPVQVNATVGQVVFLSMYNRDQFSHVFYHPQITPDETILRYVKDSEEEKNARTICKREYLAVKKGTTHLKFGLYASAFCKSLGCVSYEIIVE